MKKANEHKKLSENIKNKKPKILEEDKTLVSKFNPDQYWRVVSSKMEWKYQLDVLSVFLYK